VTKLRSVIAVAAIVWSARVFAADFTPSGVSFEYGDSDSANADVKLYRVGLQWDWKKQWFSTGNWSLGGYWDLSLGYWDNRTIAPLRTNDSITDIGFTPVFRFQQNNPKGLSPYVEAAVGLHFLSATSVSTERRFGTSFQFGDHIGAGLRFGDKGQFDVGYRYQHLSNAGIKDPNQGINFHQVRLQYNF
jgi:lipid A 3-O-deacylase